MSSVINLSSRPEDYINYYIDVCVCVWQKIDQSCKSLWFALCDGCVLEEGRRRHCLMRKQIKLCGKTWGTVCCLKEIVCWISLMLELCSFLQPWDSVWAYTSSDPLRPQQVNEDSERCEGSIWNNGVKTPLGTCAFPYWSAWVWFLDLLSNPASWCWQSNYLGTYHPYG